MNVKTLISLTCLALFARGQGVPLFPAIVMEPSAAISITVAWSANNEPTLVGYYVRTNGAAMGFTNGTQLTRTVHPTPMAVTVIASNSAGLVSPESAPVLVFQPHPPTTNIVTLSCQGVSIWTPVSWTNVWGTQFFRATNTSSTKVRMMSAPTARGPWSFWTNWPTAVTTNKPKLCMELSSI